MVFLGGGAASHEQGTPVKSSNPLKLFPQAEALKSFESAQVQVLKCFEGLPCGGGSREARER